MSKIRQMSLRDALEGGYEIINIPTMAEIESQEPGFVDQTAIIGLEVVPAILGSIAGGVLTAPTGPGVVAGVAAGGAAGGAAGNALSQVYRQARGFQTGFNPGEFAAATAFSAIPLGALPGKGALARTLTRGGQGAGLALGETTTRTLLDEGRMPTREEAVTSVLFGGVIGGTLGKVEASWLNGTLDVDNITADMTRGDVSTAIKESVDAEKVFHTGRPNVPKRFKGETSEEYSERILYTTESQLYPEIEDTVVAMADGAPSPYANREQLASLAEMYERPLSPNAELFAPFPNEQRINQAATEGYENFLDFKKGFLVDRGKFADNEALKEVRAKIAIKDHQLGKGKGATKERKKWAAEERRLLDKMGLGGLQEVMRGRQVPRPIDPLPLEGMTQQGLGWKQAIRSPFKDRPMKTADGKIDKYEQAALDVLGPNYERLWTGLVTTGAGGGVLLSELWEEDESALSQAGLGKIFGVALMGMLGAKGVRSLMASSVFRKAGKSPKTSVPSVVKSGQIDQYREDTGLQIPSKSRKVINNAKEIADDWFTPMSRRLKNIKPTINGVFRNYERKVNTTTRQYMDQVTPYITAMTKKLSKDDFRTWKLALLNGNREIIRELNNKANIDSTLYGRMETGLRKLREFAREQGGIEVGYLEDYFPRHVIEYDALRDLLARKGNKGELSEIDKAIALESGVPSLEKKAEIASKILRGYSVGPDGITPSNANPRRIAQLNNELLDAYGDPADSLKRYVESMVLKAENNRFLFKKPKMGAQQGGFEGSRDRRASDLGSEMEVDDSLAGEVARNLGTENNLNAAQVQELKAIIQARFSGRSADPLVQGIKNLNYMQVMGNFGSAVTQLGDNAYSIHFNGFDNTFKSAFAKDFDFVKHFGLNAHEIDAVTSAGGLSKALDTVFTGTGLKKLDQFGKNTFMNASWRNMKQQALNEKSAVALRKELSEWAGADRADEMIRDLKTTKIGKDTILPDSIEEAIWYKFLDVSPATLGETSVNYAKGSRRRILYMLKQFTLKQLDIYREVAGKDLSRAKKLYSEGKKGAAAKSAAKGLKSLVSLALVFGAANATTDVIKDLMYGRPIKGDDLLIDNIYKLFGVNRYLAYEVRREGPADAAIGLTLPPTAVFSRAWKDIAAFTAGEEYKGNMLQGTPLDMVYWRYLGGQDKIKRMESQD